MRIALFTETFLPKIDGITRTLSYLLKYLESNGYECVLFAPDYGITKYGSVDIIGFPCINFPLYPELRISLPIAHVSTILRRLIQFQPDIVFSINPVMLGVIGIQAGRQLGLPVAASYQTDIPGFAQRWGFGYLVPFLWNYLRWVHQQADVNFVPSEFTRRQLLAQGFHHVKVWSKGVDTQRFSPSHYSMEWRRRLTDDQPDKPLLIYVGRIAREKRVDWLLDVIKAFPSARLAIVGDGPERLRLETLFAGTPTVFTGFLEGNNLAQAYASADIMIFPGANETFGNVVSEAMASGLPVIVPRSGGVTDFVRHGENGLVFSPEDRQELLRAVGYLLDHPALRRQLGEQARIWAEARSWDQIFDQLIADLREAISAKQHYIQSLRAA